MAKVENLGPKRWQRSVLAIAEVAWEDGGRGAVFNSSEERSAVKRLAAHGYMTIGHSHRDEITASLTVKGHLLLSALRMEAVEERSKPARSASGQRRAARTAAHIERAQTRRR
jgi:hypothetical protein